MIGYLMKCKVADEMIFKPGPGRLTGTVSGLYRPFGDVII
jgi:hypothetical protein